MPSVPAPPASDGEILDVNRRYHDAAAAGYDAKWGISYGEIGRHQVRGKLAKGLGPRGRSGAHFARSLEIGAGTGYFSLNLLQDGVLGEATCTDVSPGMLEALAANAQTLGVAVETVACDAADLPFADASFDLVLGHAVLHHLPDLDAAFTELHRVLAPGGTLFFAGEPSERGDRLAAIPKRAGLRASPLWRRLVGGRPAVTGLAAADDDGDGAHALEGFVDVHAFTPDALLAHARRAGFADARVTGEELLANWFGWFNRTLEATADPAGIPTWWYRYAYRGYIALQAADRVLLEGRLPPGVFYNLLLTATR